MPRLVLVTAAALLLHLGSAPSLAQTTAVTLAAVPAPARPGGRLAYRANVINQGATTRDIEFELDYDVDIAPVASSASCVALSEPPECMIDEEEPATRWTLNALRPGEIRTLRIEVLVNPATAVTDPDTFEPRLSTTATVTELSSGATTTATAMTIVSNSASSAPFLASISAQPEPVHPGGNLAYRVTVLNAGAVERHIDLVVDYATGLGVPGWAADPPICFGQCSVPIPLLRCERDAECATGQCALGVRACRSNADCGDFGLGACLPPFIPGQTCVITPPLTCPDLPDPSDPPPNPLDPEVCRVAEVDDATRWTLRCLRPWRIAASC